MQIADEKDYDKKALLYWAKLYSGQLGSGDPYLNLNKTIGIHILNFLSIPELPKYHNVFQLREIDSNFHHFKDIELHTIELCKFGKMDGKVYANESEAFKAFLPTIRTALDRWVTFLGKYHLIHGRKLPKELKDKHVEKALEVVETMHLNKVEREIYENRLKWLMTEMSALEKAEEKGEAKGIAKGRAEGEAIGIAKGEAIGKAEEKMKIANNLLAIGIDVKTVAKATGLSGEQIKKTKKRR